MQPIVILVYEDTKSALKRTKPYTYRPNAYVFAMRVLVRVCAYPYTFLEISLEAIGPVHNEVLEA
jgi:hypothetical protein